MHAPVPIGHKEHTRGSAGLQAAVLAASHGQGLIGAGAEVAVDATGLDSRYASRHYVTRSGYKRFARLAWPKLTVACHTGSHLLLGAVFGRGPSQDSPHFPPAVRQAARLAPIGRVLGDAAYDAEHNHALCRDRLGIPESVFRLNPGTPAGSGRGRRAGGR